jgi:hypothetical protein
MERAPPGEEFGGEGAVRRNFGGHFGGQCEGKRKINI